MQLDNYQKIVVETIDNMLVLAGAGTGKTFCIINKVRYLKSHFNAQDDDFLIVSFTNESVNDLKRKINGNIDILTFHKLAIKIIDNNYSICSESLLDFIIDEYFISIITKREKRQLLLYFLTFNYPRLITSKIFVSFKQTIKTFINLMKANNLDFEYLKDIYIKEKDRFFISLIMNIYCLYEQEKRSQNKMDLDDLIIIASKTNKSFHYKYIFVDEFQDTSQIRFNLIHNIFIHSNSHIYFFGDDFQSIYHFSGCNLNIMLDIKTLIPDIKIVKLHQTFRNSQELINIANTFITKNEKQIKKTMISEKHINNPIEIIYYTNPKNAFDKLMNKLNSNTTLVLGRNNNDIKHFTNKKVNYLTVHKSKGLEAENIILINLTNGIFGFPNRIKNYYLLDKINKCDEIKYAEERRLFYVALTRTKNKVYILVPYSNPSIFIKELKTIIKK
jgi:DNA helicase-4